MNLAFFFPIDPLWIVMTAPALLFSIWAQIRVKSTFHRYAKVGVRAGMTGAQAAAAVCRAGGADDVTIERHQGFLSDHYDPRSRTLRLSPDVHDGRSISSIAVAAHEAGHAIQDAEAYAPLTMRSALVPVTQIGSQLWFLPFVIGLMLQASTLMMVGVILFAAVVVFQLVTLPVEFDASNRAKAVLATSGIVATQEEAQGVEKVLGAAALTYVAAAVAAIVQLLYMLMRARE